MRSPDISEYRYKIMVIGDTHGDLSRIEPLLPLMLQCDAIVHLGDYVKDMDGFAPQLGKKLFRVAGNGDWFSNVQTETVIEIGKHRIFATHGHLYNVRHGTELLVERAVALGCDIALYGHTHVSSVRTSYGVTVFNPGSPSYPRDGVCSYGLLCGDEIFLPKIIFA